MSVGKPLPDPIPPQNPVSYQQPAGGGGFLRLLQFLPDGRTVRIRDYSPVSDETVADPNRAYDFTLPAPAQAGSSSRP